MKLIFTSIIYLLLPVTVIRIYYSLEQARPVLKYKKMAAGRFVRWDTASLLRISPAGTRGFYPRMLLLQRGSLLLVYVSSGNIVAQESTAGGQVWSAPVVIAAEQDGINMDTPELLQLANGELLLCYNGRPQGALKKIPEAGKVFDIRIRTSNDNGKTWNGEKIVYRAGASFNDGCWEPAALQLPSGEIQLFFSDEAVYTSSDEQNISLLRSVDNGSNWTSNPHIISFRQHSRDGMPVPIWLPEQQQVALAIEDPGVRNFKPAVIRSAASGSWDHLITGNDNSRNNALKIPLPDSVYAGAPYLRRLSSGVTLLSYQSTEGRRGPNTDANAIMVVTTGDAQAKNFSHPTIPFTVPEGYHALWNSLCITRADTIIALTSTNGYSKRASEIWMIKGVLPTNQLP